MKNYYKISSEHANLIGEFEYEPHKFFTAKVCQQNDGTFLIGEEIYDLLKDTEQFKRVNFSSLTLISEIEIDIKESDFEFPVVNKPLNWKGLSQDLFYSSLFNKALSMANPNAYSTFLKVLTDGEVNYASQNALSSVFNMLGIEWTNEEKIALEKIFSQNNFSISL